MKDYSNVNETIRERIKEINILKNNDEKLAKKKESDLIKDLSYLVYAALKYNKDSQSREDLYQEGMLGLVKAIQTYNTNTTFHFVRYAMWWIKSKVMRAMKKNKIINDNKYVIQYDFEENFIIDYNNPETQMINMQTRHIITNALDEISEKQKYIINSYYGIGNDDNRSIRELGKELDIGRESLRRQKNVALEKLKELVG